MWSTSSLNEEFHLHPQTCTSKRRVEKQDAFTLQHSRLLDYAQWREMRKGTPRSRSSTWHQNLNIFPTKKTSHFLFSFFVMLQHILSILTMLCLPSAQPCKRTPDTFQFFDNCCDKQSCQSLRNQDHCIRSNNQLNSTAENQHSSQQSLSVVSSNCHYR